MSRSRTNTGIVIASLGFFGLGGYAVFHYFEAKSGEKHSSAEVNPAGGYRTGATHEVPVTSPGKFANIQGEKHHDKDKGDHDKRGHGGGGDSEPKKNQKHFAAVDHGDATEDHAANAGGNDGTTDHAIAGYSVERAILAARSPASEDEGGSAAPSAAAGGAGNLRDCPKLEFLGPGIRRTVISNADWAQVMQVFHESKDLLLGWFSHNRQNISSSTASELEKTAKRVRIQRPPATDEPDLAWRGVGVWSADDSGPVVRVGTGFIELLKKNRRRARFELVRLIAQGWAPCELKKLNVGTSPWTGLTVCLGLEEQERCESGSYSEAGWAVSTALAAHVANPGCVIPAFAESTAASCVSRIPFTVAAKGDH